MVMDRENSHLQACTSHRIEYPMFKKSSLHTTPEHMPSRATRIQRSLVELSLQDLLRLAKQLKYPGITTLRLSVSPEDQLLVSQQFGSADKKTTDALVVFSRALAHAIEGWMQNLELGVCLGLRDINALCPAIRSSTTLRHLSFANSGLGDVTLQVLSLCLQHCQSLQTLNLSGCALTDISTSIITTIVKGEDPNVRSVPQSTKKTPPVEHRAPKYGQQWRQNVILIGKWSPAPDLGDNLITPKTEVDWQTTLRKPNMVSSNRHGNGLQPTKSVIAGLVGLDLSHNSFTDALSKELCPLLYKKPPLRALNLRCNQMTRAGAKPLLDVMKELHILLLVDIRGNADEGLLGVLENGEHYTTFSTYQSPFWMNPESLDPIMCNSMKSQSNTPGNRSKFTSSSSRSSMPKKQTKATMASQSSSREGNTGSRNLSPQNSSNRTHAGGSRNNTPSKRNKTPPKANNTSPQANISPSCSGASASKTPADHWGPNGRQKRYHCSHQGSPGVCPENEDVPVLNDHNKRCILAPGKERPTPSSLRVSPQRSGWPEKTTFVDQTSQRHMSPTREQDIDTRSTNQTRLNRRFMSPGTLEPPREHPLWENTILNEFDMRDMKGPDGLGRRHTPYEGPRRAQSAGYNIHRPGHPRDYTNRQEFYKEYGHQNCYRNFSASQSPSRSPWPSTIYNSGRCDSQGKRSQEKSSPVICCHHRCKLLNEVQEQKRSRSRVAKAAWLDEHGRMPCLHPLMPKVASLPDDKKELVEWNNFVNQMTTTLLNLKANLYISSVPDGLDQLISPSEGAIAQQAATKLNQMPGSFFRSGMLRLLERSCKVLNTHVTSLTKRHKENMRHINSENQAPVVNGEFPNKKKVSNITMVKVAVALQEKQFDKSQKPLRNVPQLGVHHSNQQHRMIYHPNLPPLTTSKGTNIPQATK